TGKRMGSSIPKQFLLLDNKPIIFHTIEKFHGVVDEIIVVLPESQIDFFINLMTQYTFHVPLSIAVGGEERFHSVKRGLKLIQVNTGLVAIHDAVRPLIDKNTITKAFERALEMGCCVVAVPSKDSLRKVDGATNRSVPRDHYYLVQTPQVFDLDLLRQAYDVVYNGFTDDASVFENAGHHICLMEGTYANIKITSPEDLIIAEALLKMNY
ncbi:MAG TPA: 2-C-methyl-D-erythritol 4-phosphate cytidylyltransferase, partial [Cytophagales bacterium]|nr:2-C-methyl-D-erythritol 4-phosphate cytidylyltransferase [Cytophagales bacterium]